MRIAQQLQVSATFCPCPTTATMEGIWASILTQINTRDRDKHSPNKLKACFQAFAARLCSLASLCFSGEQHSEEKPWLAYAGASRQLPPPSSLRRRQRTSPKAGLGGSSPVDRPTQTSGCSHVTGGPVELAPSLAGRGDGIASTSSEQSVESLAGVSLIAIRLNTVSVFWGPRTKRTARCALEWAWVHSVSAQHDMKCPSKSKESHLQSPDPSTALQTWALTSQLSSAWPLQGPPPTCQCISHGKTVS